MPGRRSRVQGIGALCAIALLAAACGGRVPDFAAGVADDVVREPGRTAETMEAIRDAGFRALRVTSIWAPGQREPAAAELAVLRRVVDAATERRIRVFLAVYHAGAATTPLTPQARDEFAAYAAALVRALGVRDLIVGNEPNLNRFWMPQFGPAGEDVAAPAYLALLAATYDAVAGDATVYGGALAPRGVDRPGTGRDTHSPARFIRDLGAAYRASGRAKPVMDAFAFHPYPASSRIPPDRPHPAGKALGLADHERLRALLRAAFGADLPVLYDEYGAETPVPPEEEAAYTGREVAPTVDPATQARWYRRALRLASCQEGVVGLLLFHAFDEPRLEGWQSGVYYRDGTPKPSLPAVRAAARTAGTCP